MVSYLNFWTTAADRCQLMIALVRTSGEHGDRQRVHPVVQPHRDLPDVDPIHQGVCHGGAAIDGDVGINGVRGRCQLVIHYQ